MSIAVPGSLQHHIDITEDLLKKTQQIHDAKKQKCFSFCSHTDNKEKQIDRRLKNCYTRLYLAKNDHDNPKVHLAITAITVAKVAVQLIKLYAPDTELGEIANEITFIKNIEQVFNLPEIIQAATKVVDFAVSATSATSSCTIQ